jgi:hypothetical protein
MQESNTKRFFQIYGHELLAEKLRRLYNAHLGALFRESEVMVCPLRRRVDTWHTKTVHTKLYLCRTARRRASGGHKCHPSHMLMLQLFTLVEFSKILDS